MRWYTLISYGPSGPGIKLVDAGVEDRHVDDAVGEINVDEIREEVRSRYGDTRRGRLAYWFDKKTGIIESLVRNRVNEIWKLVHIDLRKSWGLTNFDYYEPGSMLEMPHMDVYAESPEDAKRQLVENRGAIRKCLGVEVPGSVDDLVVMDCTCRGFNKRLMWDDLREVYIDQGPLIPSGYEPSQRNCA